MLALPNSEHYQALTRKRVKILHTKWNLKFLMIYNHKHDSSMKIGLLAQWQGAWLRIKRLQVVSKVITKLIRFPLIHYSDPCVGQLFYIFLSLSRTTLLFMSFVVGVISWQKYAWLSKDDKDDNGTRCVLHRDFFFLDVFYSSEYSTCSSRIARVLGTWKDPWWTPWYEGNASTVG